MRRSSRAVALLGLAFAIVASAFLVVPVQAATERITLYGDTTGGWGLTSATIRSPGPHLTVNLGDAVNLTLNSADAVRHNWFIDYNNNSLVDSGEPSSPDFQASPINFNFTADRLGTFWYKCRYHTTMMLGQVTIQSLPTYTLYGSSSAGWGFGLANITSPGPALAANRDDTVTLDLIAQDGLSHTFVLDYNNNSAVDSGEHVSGVFSGSTPVRFTFVAERAGTFQYFCGVHGSSVMKGTFTVRGTNPAPTGGDNTVLIIGSVVIVVAVVAVGAAVMMRKKKT